MSMLKNNPVTGARYLLRGLLLIQKPGIRQYVLIPIVINTLLFSLLIWFGTNQFNHLVEWILPTWLEWLEWFLWPLFAVTASIIVFFTFIQIGNFIGAPFNSLLAEAVERHLKGHRLQETRAWRKMTAHLWPSLLSEWRKIIYFISRGIPLLVLFIIPVVNVIAPLIWMGFSAWILALEYADYPMENHGILFADQRDILKEKPLMVFGFGSAALFLMAIPFVNFLVIPSAVAGATAMWIEQFSKAY